MGTTSNSFGRADQSAAAGDDARGPRPGLGRFRSADPLGRSGSPWLTDWARLPAAGAPTAAAAAPVGAPAGTEVPTRGAHWVSRIGLHLIAESEGFRQNLYSDPAGHCTIGFGHLVHKGACNGTDPSEREYLGGITRPQGEDLLRRDVRKFEEGVNRLVTVPLTQDQFDALVDFAYNLGIGTLQRSQLLIKLNSGDYAAVPDELRRYNKAGGQVLPGLLRRREREAHLFASGLRLKRS